ncbi:MAG: YiiX/YebB-like N1pC/P60 family cysteine hydrolase [Fusobacteriaceae bacterium]
MKKIFFTAVMLIFIRCSPTNTPWREEIELVNNWDKIQVGDVIIKNKTIHPLEWYAHIGIVITPNTVADFPQPFAGYQETYYKYWLDDKNNRKVVVMRYKGMTDELRELIKKNSKAIEGIPYVVWFKKEGTESTYCSKYVWYLFWKSAKDLGYDLDLDSDGGPFVFPYDFLEAKELEYVNF